MKDINQQFDFNDAVKDILAGKNKSIGKLMT